MTVAPGLDLTSVRHLFEAEIERGIETGVQFSLSYQGHVVELALGDGGAGNPMTADTFVPWTCSSKPLGALAFAMAWESGAVDLDTPVSTVLPEFTGKGKEQVRVRNLLTHTVGTADPVLAVHSGDADLSDLGWPDIDALMWAVICDATAGPLPGSAMVYNPVTTWYVLDRLLTTLNGGQSGDSYRSLLRRLDLTATLGLDPSLVPERYVTVSASADQEKGLRAMQMASVLPLPGVGVWGAVRDLRQVGEVLLMKGVHQGVSLVRPATVEALTATHWPGSLNRSICDTDFPYGLGVMTLPAIFGRRTSARAFGHAGGNTSTLLVDPLFDLVVAVYWNGRLDDVRTFARRYALVRALYDDLGLPRLPAAGRQMAPVRTEEGER